MERLRAVIERYHLDRWFEKENLIVLVLVGVLLVVIGLPIEGKDTESPTGKAEIQVAEESEKQETLERNPYEYAEALEEKLKKTLERMRGVGKVEVFITLEASEEMVVEKDESLNRNNTMENDSSGGNRNVYQVDSKEETVYQKKNGEECPYVTKTIYPKVAGVLVVAEGAGTGTISNDICKIGQTLFDIEAHKVQVVPMGDS